jgi:superfamily II DNA or RNA helicase
MVMPLRPYQRLALYHLRRCLEAGVRRLYVELPAGTRKSTIAAAFAAQRLGQTQERVLMLVHRQDLALQLTETLRQEGLGVGLLTQGSRVLYPPVMVATIQSLTPETTRDLLAANQAAILTLARHLLRDGITTRLVERVAARIGQRSTLVFASNVQHAEHLSAAFCARGFSTAVVSGRTGRKRREELFAGWRSGIIQVVCNCALLTEGIDMPTVAALVIARPTLSPGLYTQMLGRGMRTADGKTDCLMIDVMGNQPDPGRQVVLPHVIGIEVEPEDEQHPEKRARSRRTDPLLRSVPGGQGETELALLDPLGRSQYRWNDYGAGYFATINAHTIAIIDRDPAQSGLYRSQLYTEPPGQLAEHRWLEGRRLPLRQ